MLSIIIIENDNQQLKKIRDIVEKATVMNELQVKILLVDLPQKIISIVKEKEDVGLYFIDVIYKNKLIGFQLADQIRLYDPRGFFVFLSTNIEIRSMSFEYGSEALDCILKDFSNQMENRICQCILKAYERYNLNIKKDKSSICIKNGDRLLYILLQEILFINTSFTVHKLEIHTKDKSYDFYGSLKSLQEYLQKDFIRCHKSFIINKNFIQCVDKKERKIQLSNHIWIPTSLKYLKTLLQLGFE